MFSEWPLIVFTIVMQLAVGSFVILGGIHFFAARRYGSKEADKLSDYALLAIGPAVALGIILSLLHLGNPMNAPYAIAHFGTSWLSREIILSLAFSGIGAVFALLQWRKIGSSTLRNALALIGAAVGLVLVYAISMVYQIATVPAWNTPLTTVSFFITAFLLGSLAIGAALVINYWNLRRKSADQGNTQYIMLATTLKWIALISVVLLGMQFIVIPLYLAALATNPTNAASDSLDVLFSEYGLLFVLRLVLIFLGAGVFAVFLYRMASSNGSVRVLGNLAVIAFTLVLVSEVLGRFLFYASMVRVGI